MAGGETMGKVAADQAAMDTGLLQDIEQGDPIDLRRLHDDSLDVIFDRPVGDGMEVGSVIAEGAHYLDLVGAGNADVDLLDADVDVGSAGVDHGQAIGGTDLALVKRGGCALGDIISLLSKDCVRSSHQDSRGALQCAPTRVGRLARIPMQIFDLRD